ncbi:hypothetical protein BD626DRAFT_512982 [Schizophyllum amplum]|uniref:Uncharacterized protein n=1 Tax=Schizophyllum amplum TaxID=97359 RepID=A0A550BZM9_9AGAR|nr:hypothetical protein BD626DRAFT_512982 [Auriculariopsis ampla]
MTGLADVRGRAGTTTSIHTAVLALQDHATRTSHRCSSSSTKCSPAGVVDQRLRLGSKDKSSPSRPPSVSTSSPAPASMNGPGERRIMSDRFPVGLTFGIQLALFSGASAPFTRMRTVHLFRDVERKAFSGTYLFTARVASSDRALDMLHDVPRSCRTRRWQCPARVGGVAGASLHSSFCSLTESLCFQLADLPHRYPCSPIPCSSIPPSPKSCSLQGMSCETFEDECGPTVET